MSISNRPLQPPTHSSNINLFILIIIIILDYSDHHTRSRGIARERERERDVKNPLILFMAENNSENVDVDPHSNTRTSGTVTCLPVAAVECLKLKR